jgi:hypothetical protein
VLVRTLALIVAAAWIPGCYTLFRHPPLLEIGYRRPPAGQACRDCHTSAQQIGFVRPDRLDPEPSPWGDLEHPWWIDRGAPADTTRGDGGRSR